MKIKKFISLFLAFGILTSSFISFGSELSYEDVVNNDLVNRGLTSDDLISSEDKFYEIKPYDELSFSEKTIVDNFDEINSESDVKFLDDDQVAIEKSEDEYESSQKVAPSRSGRSVNGNGGVRSSDWMRITLNLYDNGSRKYSAYVMWEMLTRPVFTYTDFCNLFFSSNVTTVWGSQSSYYEANKYNLAGLISETNRGYPPIQHNNQGITQKINLVTFATGVTKHRGYIASDLTFRTSQRQTGDIYSEYFHTALYPSGLSISPSGSISISTGANAKKTSGPSGKIIY